MAVDRESLQQYPFSALGTLTVQAHSVIVPSMSTPTIKREKTNKNIVQHEIVGVGWVGFSITFSLTLMIVDSPQHLLRSTRPTLLNTSFTPGTGVLFHFTAPMSRFAE